MGKKLLSTAQDASYALCTHICSTVGWVNLHKLDINILIDELGKSEPNTAQTSDWHSAKLCEQTVASKTDGGWLLNREVGESGSRWTSPISFPFPLLEGFLGPPRPKGRAVFLLSDSCSFLDSGADCGLWVVDGLGTENGGTVFWRREPWGSSVPCPTMFGTNSRLPPIMAPCSQRCSHLVHRGAP